MESTARLRKRVLVGLGVGALVLAILGALPIGDYGKGLTLNLSTELAGALITYLLIELLIGQTKEREGEKEELIEQLGSRVRDVAVAAADKLRSRGWLFDGSLRDAVLIGANLQGAWLAEADLQGAQLSSANLHGAWLSEANLQGATLSGANLEWATLTGANLQGADLQGASLFDARLQGANLFGANLQGARLERNLWDSSVISLDFSRKTDFKENTTLPDGQKWTPDTDMARFTDPDHSDFWRPDA